MKPLSKRLLFLAGLGALVALGLYVTEEARRVQHQAEILSTTGQAIMRRLSEVAQGIGNSDLDTLQRCYTPTATAGPGAWVETLVSERDGVEVYDWRNATGDEPTPGPHLLAWLDHLHLEVRELDKVRFKLAAIESLEGAGEDRTAVVRSVLWLRGSRTDGQDFESQARYRITLRQGLGEWRIQDQELLHGTTVMGARQGFVDVAKTAGIGFRAQHNPLFETETWRPETFGIIRYGSAGVAAADLDGDGWDDLFFSDGKSPRLYRNVGAETTPGSDFPRFEDITRAAGLPDELPGVNVALAIDLDNDGDRDLLLGRFMEGSRLYRNDGPGPGCPASSCPVRFTDVTADARLGGPFVVVAAAADADLDGDLDLYLGRYLDPRTDLPTTLFYTRNGQGNSLLRNDGDLRFTDITDQAGVREGGLTLGVSWGDIDDDGDPDLYVANDFGRNALLRNEGPGQRFTDISAESDAIDFGFGMSASMGDVDNDGALDLYVSNVHSGQRWYSQAVTLSNYLLTSLRQGTLREDFPLYREIYGFAGADWRNYGDRMVKGNSLLVNDGKGGFSDIAETVDANPFGWYWGTAFLDYDNDGWLDLYAANGWISGRSDDDL